MGAELEGWFGVTAMPGFYEQSEAGWRAGYYRHDGDEVVLASDIPDEAAAAMIAQMAQQAYEDGRRHQVEIIEDWLSESR